MVVCHAGVFRSGFIKELLQKRGYEADNVGPLNPDSLNVIKERSKPYDAVLYMTNYIKSEFEEKAKVRSV